MHRRKCKSTENQLMCASSNSEPQDNLKQSRGLKLDGKFTSKLFSKHGNSNDILNSKVKQSGVKCKLDDKTNEDLPDGSCFSRVLRLEPSSLQQDSCENAESAIKKCEYVGSFPVAGSDHGSRAEFVRTQLEQMRDNARKKSILLVVSLTGIKVCSPDGKSVYMAHALRRISFATCDPQHTQFSFLAREPNGHFSLQYCHSFITESSKEIFKYPYKSSLKNIGWSNTIIIGRNVHLPKEAILNETNTDLGVNTDMLVTK